MDLRKNTVHVWPWVFNVTETTPYKELKSSSLACRPLPVCKLVGVGTPDYLSSWWRIIFIFLHQERTPQYRANGINSASLELRLQHVLGKVTAKCFWKDLISRKDRNSANNERESTSVRSGDLVDAIFESHSKWYKIFMEILEEYIEGHSVSNHPNIKPSIWGIGWNLVQM